MENQPFKYDNPSTIPTPERVGGNYTYSAEETVVLSDGSKCKLRYAAESERELDLNTTVELMHEFSHFATHFYLNAARCLQSRTSQR